MAVVVVLVVLEYDFSLQIAENDDLPHKICFRCSAKLEELYEFIQKCIKTQENLRTAVGKTGPFITKTKTRKAWEDKLNKTNMSNDDICDALIKKAMEGIKDIPLKPSIKEESPPPTKRVTRRTDVKLVKTEPIEDEKEELKEIKSTQEKIKEKVPTTKSAKSSYSTPSNSSILANILEPPQPSINKKMQNEKKTSETKVKNDTLNSLSFDYVQDKSSSDTDDVKEIVDEKPFNIMDYISMIKVNGVGVLFQCKLCNRNFLKKEVVESHNCAKNGVPKVAIPKAIPTPEPPKVSTVKYITIDSNTKKPHSSNSYKLDNDYSSITDKPSKDSNINKDDSRNADINQKVEHSIHSAPPVKPKPKAGPASKTRRVENSDPGSSQNSSDSQQSELSNSQSPSVHVPAVPNLNGRFKLVPGPNNIFTLVEETSTPATVTENQKTSKKRKSEPEYEKSKERRKDSHEKYKSSHDLINVETESKPYPVGLFQTVGHSANLYNPPVSAPPASFTTPAMKKQSYTIVQTGDPSKLLISTKAIPPPAEVPKKRQRKSKPEVREDIETKEPFQVTLEDVAHPKDSSGFFTFINVDPLLQPSYVLPTDNIIQESQISTSTATVQKAPEIIKESKDKDKDKYSCNMCGDSFSREKKLLTHIQSHYSKMDEEDQMRAQKASKKKGKK